MSFAPFGTGHNELETEDAGVSKKPTRVEDEIVTDEKGRRRFHGAFTGGFSAGYFNTVGSKGGWEPQTFKSTRNERAEKYKSTADDYMDEEDRGQFGFAARKIRVRDDFMENATGGGSGQSSALAWERSSPSTSRDPVGMSDLVARLESAIRPVNDSIGVRILKKMGWRPGKGVGPRMKRRALEKQRVLDARSRGESTRFDEKAVRDIEELAPETEFAPEDVPRFFIEQNTSQHGIGYKPLEHTNVLDESFALKVDALKNKNNSRGIRGQAFGVGAYEEDDDDIYTSEDLSKYDYAIGGDTTQNLREIERYDSKFVPATETERPVFYTAPQPTRHFDPRHRAQPITLKNLPEALDTAVHNLTPLQKAVFLGDRSGSIMEMLSDADRQKLEVLTRKAEKEIQFGDKKRQSKEDERKRAQPEPFEEEPLKAHRFKKYVHYLKSGYDMQPPLELTRLEWERELAEFENHLTPELRSLLPSVRSRQEPLANLKTAQPIADLLKSRFQSENSSEAKTESKLVTERREAVKQKKFGPITRTKYKWHPSKLLCKYFNVEDPFPGSQSVGSWELQKRVPPPQMSGQIDSLGNLGLPNTQRDVLDRMGREAQDRRLKQDGSKGKTRWDESTNDEDNQRKYTLVEKPTFLPPIKLLQSVFELPDIEKSSSSSDSETEDKRPTFESLTRNAEKSNRKSVEKFITINDIVPDDEYGPKVPDSLTSAIPSSEKVKITPVAPQPKVIQLDSSDDGENYRPDRKRKRSKSQKESGKKRKKDKKDKKEKRDKKSKKSKKSKKRRHSGSD